MDKYNVERQGSPEEVRMSLDEIVHNGAVEMLKKALAVEIAGYLQQHEADKDKQGYAKERRVTTGAGELRIRVPRVDEDTAFQKQLIAAIFTPHKKYG